MGVVGELLPSSTRSSSWSPRVGHMTRASITRYFELFVPCSSRNGRKQFGVISLSELKLAVAANSDDQHLNH